MQMDHLGQSQDLPQDLPTGSAELIISVEPDRGPGAEPAAVPWARGQDRMTIGGILGSVVAGLAAAWLTGSDRGQAGLALAELTAGVLSAVLIAGYGLARIRSGRRAGAPPAGLGDRAGRRAASAGRAPGPHGRHGGPGPSEAHGARVPRCVGPSPGAPGRGAGPRDGTWPRRGTGPPGREPR